MKAKTIEKIHGEAMVGHFYRPKGDKYYYKIISSDPENESFCIAKDKKYTSLDVVKGLKKAGFAADGSFPDFSDGERHGIDALSSAAGSGRCNETDSIDALLEKIHRLKQDKEKDKKIKELRSIEKTKEKQKEK
ncbi:hypothetical protein M1141_01020 [Candidatus Marsarchaeota archaeon]|nr:hypothetical protein [Candidatus Marsarchaeota archaeon]